MKQELKKEAEDLPKGIVVILLVTIIILSLINTFAVLTFINNAKDNTSKETVTSAKQAGANGVVQLNLIAPPTGAENG